MNRIMTELLQDDSVELIWADHEFEARAGISFSDSVLYIADEKRE